MYFDIGPLYNYINEKDRREFENMYEYTLEVLNDRTLTCDYIYDICSISYEQMFREVIDALNKFLYLKSQYLYVKRFYKKNKNKYEVVMFQTDMGLKSYNDTLIYYNIRLYRAINIYSEILYAFCYMSKFYQSNKKEADKQFPDGNRLARIYSEK